MLNEDKEYIVGAFQELAALEKLEKECATNSSVVEQYKYKKEEVFDDFVLVVLLSLVGGNLFEYYNGISLISMGRERFSICKDLNLNAYIMRINLKLRNEQEALLAEGEDASHIEKMMASISKFKDIVRVLFFMLETDAGAVHLHEEDDGFGQELHLDINFHLKNKKMHGFFHGYLSTKFYGASKEYDDIKNVESSVNQISKFNLDLFSALK